MARLYPQCGLNARDLGAEEMTTRAIARLLETAFTKRLPLIDRQWLYFDGDANARSNPMQRKVNVNKRATVLLRQIDPAVARHFSALRGHVILMTEDEHKCLK